MKDYFFFC